MALTGAHPTIDLVRKTKSEGTPPSIWGADVVAMHDRYWASRGVEVVRPGTAPTKKGPVLYLLLTEHQLVDLDLDGPLRRFHWLNPKVLRLRILRPHRTEPRERVHADGQGRFLRVERFYRSRDHVTAQAWLTHDPAIARRWSEHATGAESHDAMRQSRMSDGSAPAPTTGRAFDASHDDDVVACWKHLCAIWSKPDAVFTSVYEYAAGVWVHELAEIDAGARLIGPLWIGAGQKVGADDTLVGPEALIDSSGQRPELEEIDWDEAKSASWDLPSLSSAGLAQRLAKRAFDVAFSAAVLLATLPLYPIIMALIYREDGRPFFFMHRRQTRGGREFPCVKFRTMYRDAEIRKRDLIAANVCDGPQFFMKDDPRVLRIGRFLRTSHLDELPQFWNVLVGQMSVVGPRPSPDKENQYCPAWREARLSVRPGVTGLWQVRSKREPETDFQEWIRYDLEYVQHYSFGRDIRIILETVRRMTAR